MTNDRKRAFILLAAGIVIVAGFFTFATVGVAKVTVPASAAAKSDLPPHNGPDTDTPFYNPYDPALCGSNGLGHFYTLDEGKESPRAFGPPATGTDAELIDEFFVRLCGDEATQRGADPMLMRAIEAAVFWGKVNPNRPLDDGWREETRDLVSRIDWNSIRVERGRQSAPGTHSMYMYVGVDGVPNVGLVEVKPRTGTYLWIKVRTGDGWGEDSADDGWTEIGLRADCGFQPDFPTE